MFIINKANKALELIKTNLSSLKIKNLKKKIEKYELRLKKINLKKSLNLFYYDKILDQADKPFTYFTKVKIRNNFKQADKLCNKYDSVREKVKRLEKNLVNFSFRNEK